MAHMITVTYQPGANPSSQIIPTSIHVAPTKELPWHKNAYQQIFFLKKKRKVHPAAPQEIYSDSAADVTASEVGCRKHAVSSKLVWRPLRVGTSLVQAYSHHFIFWFLPFE
jgi:hypothetical protein